MTAVILSPRLFVLVLSLAYLSNAQCVSDAGCALTQFCDIPVGATVGTCQTLTGQCGMAIDHYGYECGPEPGCPRCPGLSQCVNHKCVVIELICPNLGLIGETEHCTAAENNKSCARCDYEITSPGGIRQSGRTDANGTIPVLLTAEGSYRIALIRGNATVKSAEISSVARMPDDERPPSFLSIEPLALIGLVALLVIAAATIVLLRMRPGKKIR